MTKHLSWTKKLDVIHHARWMGVAIYIVKIFIIRSDCYKAGISIACVILDLIYFIVYLYSRFWLILHTVTLGWSRPSGRITRRITWPRYIYLILGLRCNVNQCSPALMERNILLRRCSFLYICMHLLLIRLTIH